jgi:hypothetical protein
MEVVHWDNRILPKSSTELEKNRQNIGHVTFKEYEIFLKNRSFSFFFAEINFDS